jgi:hypothetical protein
MEQPRARIFVSSTTEDLKQYRAAAVEAIQKLGYEAVVLELTEARDSSPLQLSRELIASCDAFVSLIAFRYGFIPSEDNPNQYSFVELELRHAWELGKPTFVFMVDENTLWPPNFIDGDNRPLRKLREEVLKRRVVAFVTSSSDLARKVGASLATWTRERPGTPKPADRPSGTPPVDVAIPTTVDQFELAWRLVVDFKAEPALLAGMDAEALLRAARQWAHETRPDDPIDGPALFDAAQTHLRSKQGTLGPSPLWLAWKRAAASGQPPPPPPPPS